MEKPRRFLELWHAGEAGAAEIDEYIERWHRNELTGSDRYVALHVYLGMTWTEYTLWVNSDELPSPEEHALQGRSDITFVAQPEVSPETLMQLHTHGPLRCRPPCPVHWPSDHPQAYWLQGWDPDLGIMTRGCGHGMHHPDPDDQQVRLHAELAEHPCDGCCRPTIDGECVGDPGPAAPAFQLTSESCRVPRQRHAPESM